jgi:hypothetical protein
MQWETHSKQYQQIVVKMKGVIAINAMALARLMAKIAANVMVPESSKIEREFEFLGLH